MEKAKVLQTTNSSFTPFYIQEKRHLHGNLINLSDCALFDSNSRERLLIAPFYNLSRPFIKDNILIWKPKTLKLLAKISTSISRTWKLWGYYYAYISRLSSTNKEAALWICFLKGNGVKRVKKIKLEDAVQIKEVLISKTFKTTYIIKGNSINVLDCNFKSQYFVRLLNHIQKAYLCDELKILVTTSWNFISIHQLDEKGLIKKLFAVLIRLSYEIIASCLEQTQLYVLTTNSKPCGMNECYYLAKFRLANDSYQIIQGEKQFSDGLNGKRHLQFLLDIKAILYADVETFAFEIVSMKTGQILFKSLSGPFLMMDSLEGTVFRAEMNVIQKLAFAEDDFFKELEDHKNEK